MSIACPLSNRICECDTSDVVTSHRSHMAWLAWNSLRAWSFRGLCYTSLSPLNSLQSFLNAISLHEPVPQKPKHGKTKNVNDWMPYSSQSGECKIRFYYTSINGARLVLRDLRMYPITVYCIVKYAIRVKDFWIAFILSSLIIIEFILMYDVWAYSS